MELNELRTKGLLWNATAPSAAVVSFPFGFGQAGLHEVAEASYGDKAAGTGFLLSVLGQQIPGLWVWIHQTAISLDTGIVPETAAQSYSSSFRLNVQTRTLREALWTTEEAIVSGAPTLVIAELSSVDFTATRRLSLAAERYGVPVILLLPYTCEGATAAATRWRINSLPSSRNRYDQYALGNPRWKAVLDRCRIAPSAAGQSFELEWNDETLSLDMVTRLAVGPITPGKALEAVNLRRRAS